MLAVDILEALKCQTTDACGKEVLDQDYQYVFAADLMSDVLCLVDDKGEHTVFLTGLVNIQSLKTASMLDINLVIFVRDKQISQELIDFAIENKINIYQSKKTMFESCGILYELGLKCL